MNKDPKNNLDLISKIRPEFIQESKKSVLRMAAQLEKNKNQPTNKHQPTKDQR